MADTVQRMIAFFGKAEARDKFGRLFQFGARMVMGMYVGSSEAADKEILEKATAMQNVLMNSRHTLRWMKFLNFISPLKNAKEISFLILSKLCMFIFFVFDAIRWLQKIKLVPGDAGFKEWHPLNGNGKFSISWLAFGSAFGVLHHLSAHMREADDKKRAACRKNAFKSALMAFQGFHLSQLHVSNNTYCGAAGVISSAMDVQTQWAATAPKK